MNILPCAPKTSFLLGALLATTVAGPVSAASPGALTNLGDVYVVSGVSLSNGNGVTEKFVWDKHQKLAVERCLLSGYSQTKNIVLLGAGIEWLGGKRYNLTSRWMCQG
ncbi:hypothetical protein ACFQS6_19015 [Xanthomonas populi]|uniref:hypothetical protein n=1 Tax=Xanthomonas populi TaxID=53414 RepID=UPI000FF8B4B2|nr:hypothetical protein [Xanthomonas populi]